MDEERIPPAVTFHFEKVIALVAEHARLDAAEWAIRSHELMGQLEYRWREGIEMGLSTDAAQERALELFGNPETVGRRFRKPWQFSLLLSPSWQVARIVIFVIASFLAQNSVYIHGCAAVAASSVTNNLHDSLRKIDASNAKHSIRSNTGSSNSDPSTDSDDTPPVKVYRDYSYTLYQAVSVVLMKHKDLMSLASWMAVVAPFVISFQQSRTKGGRFDSPLAKALMVPVIFCVLLVMLAPICQIVSEYWYHFQFTRIPGSLVYIGIGVLGGICLLSDALGLPQRQKSDLLKVLGY